MLIDSKSKKTRFLRHISLQLGLSNVTVVQRRVEHYRPQERFDTVVSRAFASSAAFVRAAGHQCQCEGRLLAMKGSAAQDELADIPSDFEVIDIHRLTVPGLQRQRNLLVMRKKNT